MRHIFIKVNTLFLCISSTSIMCSVVWRRFVPVLISNRVTYLSNSFCRTCSLEIFHEKSFAIYFQAIFYFRVYKCMIKMSNCICGHFVMRLFKETNKNFISELHTYPSWAFHVSFSSVVIPRYLTTPAQFITMFSVAISRTFPTNGLLGVSNTTKLFLFMLIISLFFMRHRLSFWNVNHR